MMQVKQAIFSKIEQDSILQAKIGGQFYLGRVPLKAVITRERAALVLVGQTAVVGGSSAKEQMTFTFTIKSQSHDLAEAVAEDLDRLFHTRQAFIWRNLVLPGQLVGKARIRREFAADVPQEGSELIERVARFRVLYAAAA